MTATFRIMQRLGITGTVLACTLGLIAFAPAAHAGALPPPSYYLSYLSTTQAGGNTGLDNSFIRKWEVTASTDWYLGGGKFVMQQGNNVDDGVTLALYEDNDHLAELATGLDFRMSLGVLNQSYYKWLSYVTIPVDSNAWATSQYKQVAFNFSGAGYQLQQGKNYVLALFTTTDGGTAATSGAEGYKIKDQGDYGFYDSTGHTPENPAPVPAETPEPASMMLAGSGIVAAVIIRRRRQGSRQD